MNKSNKMNKSQKLNKQAPSNVAPISNDAVVDLENKLHELCLENCRLSVKIQRVQDEAKRCSKSIARLAQRSRGDLCPNASIRSTPHSTPKIPELPVNPPVPANPVNPVNPVNPITPSSSRSAPTSNSETVRVVSSVIIPERPHPIGGCERELREQTARLREENEKLKREYNDLQIIVTIGVICLNFCLFYYCFII